MSARRSAVIHQSSSADARPVRIGCVPLVDCAPLVAAKVLGIFSRHGLTVELSWQLGWANIREGIHYRQFDCAHAIAGLVFAMRAGTGAASTPVFAPFVLNLHGNAITLSRELLRSGVQNAAGLGKYVRSQSGQALTFAAVSRCSTHYFLLRGWLTEGGLDPDKDVRLVILPPRLMPECLEAGLIDGFCSGEPWNSLAINAGTGWCPAVSSELAPGHAEKVLLVHELFAAESPDRLARLLAALSEACRWCDVPQNRPQLAKMLADTGHFPDCAVLETSLAGPFPDGTGAVRDAGSFYVFHREDANRPTAARGVWILNEMIRHGVLPADSSRSDLLQQCWHPAV
jgi:ABC-type nitrate/sulfonate/bicarbonate transport system substrate-binding protein